MGMPNDNFEIIFRSGPTGSVQDWERALRAPVAELPPLSLQQKEMAGRFRVSEADYARGYLVQLNAEKRMRERGLKLGRAVRLVLGALGPSYQLVAMIYEMPEQWTARIRTPEKTVDVEIAFDLVDRVTASSTTQDQEDLKVQLLTDLERKELIRKTG